MNATTPTPAAPNKALLLKKLLPMQRLGIATLQQLGAKSKLVQLNKGKPVFQQGKADSHTIYLIRGALLLKSADGKKILIKSGTPTARNPIHNFQPRRCSAWTQLPTQLLLVDSDALDHAITLEQVSAAGVEVAGMQSGGNGQGADSAKRDTGADTVDWMSLMLQAPAFAQVPPSNFQALFMRMEEVIMKKNEPIIKQGAPGDFFYVIKRGTCKVTRTMEGGKVMPLAILKAGQSFGEEALLTEAPRNANVIANSDVALMRLGKKDFNELLKEPMIHWVSRKEADKLVAEGAKWLDVRLEDEHKETGLEGSVNLPLYLLRLKAKTLDEKSKYVVYCDTGRRSSAAAFLLTEKDIEAYCLRGGLRKQ